MPIWKKRANRICIILGEDYINRATPLSSDIVQAFHAINQAVQNSLRVKLEVQLYGPSEKRLVTQLKRLEEIINHHDLPGVEMIRLKVPVTQVLSQSFNRHSIVFISALRFSLIAFVSALFAYSFELPRSFWIPLTTVSVLSGITVVATLTRSVQRAFGKVFGILIATGLMALQPGELLIVFLYLSFQLAM